MEENLDSSQTTLKPLFAKKRIIVNKAVPEIGLGNEQVAVQVEKNIKTVWFVKQGPTKVNCSIPKDSYYANDKIPINLEIDNSRCDKNVKEIKVKVWRHIRCSAINDSKTYEDKTMLICQVYPGVKHNLKETKILEVDLNIFGDLERKIKKM